jgi:Endosomal/lysosomal potassium channel TMEM175
MSKNRVETCGDGAFAIVITFVILNVHLDRQQALTLDAPRNLGPDVFAFILSFVIVGVYWVSHHNRPRRIRAVGRRLLWLNLVCCSPLYACRFQPRCRASILATQSPMAVWPRAYPWRPYGSSRVCIPHRSWCRRSGLFSGPGMSPPALCYSLQTRRFLFCPIRFLTGAWLCWRDAVSQASRDNLPNGRPRPRTGRSTRRIGGTRYGLVANGSDRRRSRAQGQQRESEGLPGGNRVDDCTQTGSSPQACQP